MDWKFTGSEPVYQQIKKQLGGAILAGVYPAGSRVPSVRELAADARVNPNTMQRALSELEREAILVSGGTMGRCVTSDQTVLDKLHQQAVAETVRSCMAQFRALGLSPRQAAAMLAELEDKEEEA